LVRVCAGLSHARWHRHGHEFRRLDLMRLVPQPYCCILRLKV
jgi:hypothetical protein